MSTRRSKTEPAELPVAPDPLDNRESQLLAIARRLFAHRGFERTSLRDIAEEAKITKADAGRALQAFMTVTSKTLKKGERVALVGFGTFSVAKRAARNGRNPQTGKPIKIAAKKVAKFKAGAELSSRIK